MKNYDVIDFINIIFFKSTETFDIITHFCHKIYPHCDNNFYECLYLEHSGRLVTPPSPMDQIALWSEI